MAAKRLLILGATGGTGRSLVAQALEQGHHVTALVRDPSRLGSLRDRVDVVQGDCTRDDELLSEAVRGKDAVISALGVGKSFDSRNLIGTCMPRVVNAMQVNGVHRLIHLSAFGVGDTLSQIPFVPKLFVRTLLRGIYRDKAAGEKAIHGSSVDWTVVYPTGLSDRKGGEAIRSGEQLALRGFPTIARADVAAFLLSQLSDVRFVRRNVLVTAG